MNLQVAGAHGDRHGAELFAAALEAHAGRPQAVAHGHLDPVFRRYAGELEAAGHLIVEHVDVPGGIGQDFALAGRAARGVDAHDVLIGHAAEREGVAPAQILGVDGRQPGQIVERADVVGADAGLFENLPVLGGLFSLMHGPAQALGLNFVKLFVSV